MSSLYTCSYCKKNFSTQSNLINHKNHAKYCIKKRGEILDTNFNCEHCQSIFTSKQRIISHKKICVHTILNVIRKKNIILEKYIKKLELELKLKSKISE